MRISEIDILIVPGWTNAGPDHWQSRWQRNMKSARRVEQDDWDRPKRGPWVQRILEAVAEGTRPAVIVAHSCGVAATVHAAANLAGSRVAGAFLVSPPDFEVREPVEAFVRKAQPGIAVPEGFLPLPMAPLPFPSKLIASSTSPFCSIERAQEFGKAWGSDVSIIANAGHISASSGHGPWPEGVLTLGMFLKKLG